MTHPMCQDRNSSRVVLHVWSVGPWESLRPFYERVMANDFYGLTMIYFVLFAGLPSALMRPRHQRVKCRPLTV